MATEVTPELGRQLLLDADHALLEAKRRGKCQALHHADLKAAAGGASDNR
jgi:hypothetical protein